MNNNSRVACCNICLLSDAMKDCKNCPFNPGKLNLKPSEIKAVQKTELLPKVDPFLKFAEGYLKNIPNGAK